MTTLTLPLRGPRRDRPARRGRAGHHMHGGPITYAILIVAFLVSIFPFYWAIVGATRSNVQINANPPPFLPGGNLLHNLNTAMQQADLVKAMTNSFIVCGAVTVSTVLLSTLAGFAFAKLRFRGRNLLLFFVIGTLMVPPQLGVIPLYQVIAKFHWEGQLQSVILPSLVSAFGVFFMRQYLISALPTELVEAARVDGATTLRIFRSVVLPAARPAMAVLALLTFMQAWNDFFWPLVALTGANPTMQVALSGLGQGYVHDQSVILAGTVFGTLPVLVVFLLLGRQIVSGIMQGAVKA